MTAPTTQQLLDAATVAVTSQHSLVESIRELNARFLLTVRDALQAGHYEGAPNSGTVGSLIARSDADAIVQASRLPFLLMDLGRLDSGVDDSHLSPLDAPTDHCVQDRTACMAHPEHLSLAQSALAIGWHAARTDLGATLLLLGMAPGIATRVATLPYSRIERLAQVCAMPLTVRWNRNAQLWSELLSPTAQGSVESVRGFVMHAVQLTAATHLKRAT